MGFRGLCEYARLDEDRTALMGIGLAVVLNGLRNTLYIVVSNVVVFTAPSKGIARAPI